jgi:hypothetical protein
LIVGRAAISINLSFLGFFLMPAAREPQIA